MSLNIYLEKIYPWQRKHGQWVTVSLKELDNKTLEHLWGMYQKTYGSQGLDNVPKEVFINRVNLAREGYKLYWFIDLDHDPDPDAFIIFKQIRENNKVSLMGSDGKSESQQRLITQFIKLLKRKGWYVEASKKVDKLCRDFNIPPITEKEKIEKLIKKSFTMASEEDLKKDENNYPSTEKGYYIRKLSQFDPSQLTVNIIKRIYGNPYV